MSFWALLPAAAAIAAIVLFLRLRARIEALEFWSKEVYAWVQVAGRRLRALEEEIAARRDAPDSAGASAPDVTVAPAPVAKPALAEDARVDSHASATGAAETERPEVHAVPATVSAATPSAGSAAAPVEPPSPPPLPPAPQFGAPPTTAGIAGRESAEGNGFDWETLVGVRLFSWIAGIALVLAALFFLRYSVERGWLQPPVRYALGLAVGLGALVVGELWTRRGYAVTANAVTAAGIGVLFATDYAGYALWKIVGAGTTFLLLAVVTVAAVVLSVRRSSLFIALLGLASGFATPALLATGEDRPISLFGYLLMLNAGLGWVAWRMRWAVVAGLSLLLTTVYQIGWAAKFLDPTKLPLAIAIFSIFALVAIASVALAARDAGGATDADGQRSAIETLAGASALVPLVFVFFLVSKPAYAEHSALLLGYLACLACGLFAVAVLRGPELLHLVGGGATTLVLLRYVESAHRGGALPRALPILLAVAGFAALYLLSPTMARRVGRPFGGAGLSSPIFGSVLISAIALLLVHRPATAPSPVFGVVFALVALAAVVSARAVRPSFYLVAASLALVCEAIWIVRGRPAIGAAIGVVTLAALFFVAVPFAARRIAAAAEPDREGVPADTIGLALGGLLLFAALAARPGAEVATLWIGALALVAQALILAAFRLGRPWWALVAYAVTSFALAVGIRAFATRPVRELVDPDLARWTLALALLLWLPFVVRAGQSAARRESAVEPYRAAVVAGGLLLAVGREAAIRSGLDDVLGLLPLALALLVAPVALRLYRDTSAADLAASRGTGPLALVAGAVVGLVAVAIPMQLEKQWITIGWALLAASLAGLYRRVPHHGLVVAATTLGLAAFARLALNPEVFAYFPRQGPPIWNWYLYSYLTTAVALFVAARCLRDASRGPAALRPAPLLAGAATILLFVLLNIEIADLFSTGEQLTFGFLGGSAGLSEDLAYTIGWALFAIALLAVGVVRALRAPRIAAIVLLVVTVLKAFLHDTWNLGGLYRVASLVGLAVSLALVAMVLQKYVLKRGEAE